MPSTKSVIARQSSKLTMRGHQSCDCWARELVPETSSRSRPDAGPAQWRAPGSWRPAAQAMANVGLDGGGRDTERVGNPRTVLAHRDQAEDLPFAVTEMLSRGEPRQSVGFAGRQHKYRQVTTRFHIGRCAVVDAQPRAIGHQQLERSALDPFTLKLVPTSPHSAAILRSGEIVDPPSQDRRQVQPQKQADRTIGLHIATLIVSDQHRNETALKVEQDRRCWICAAQPPDPTDGDETGT